MAAPRFSQAVWRERIAQWRDSGLSLQAFGEQSGFPADRLSYWARRLQHGAQSGLVPARVQQPSAVADVELRSPSGWAMRIGAGTDPAWLAALLSGLR